VAGPSRASSALNARQFVFQSYSLRNRLIFLILNILRGVCLLLMGVGFLAVLSFREALRSSDALITWVVFIVVGAVAVLVLRLESSVRVALDHKCPIDPKALNGTASEPVLWTIPGHSWRQLRPIIRELGHSAKAPVPPVEPSSSSAPNPGNVDHHPIPCLSLSDWLMSERLEFRSFVSPTGKITSVWLEMFVNGLTGSLLGCTCVFQLFTVKETAVAARAPSVLRTRSA